MSATGFIIQPTYRIESGRPVVHLFGRLESGQTFLVRDHREVPHFFVPTRDAPRARDLGAAPLVPTGLLTLQGEPVSRVEVPVPPDTPPLRDRLIGAGVPCYEADVRFAMRYLIDRGIRGALRIDGPARRGERVGQVFEDPQVAPAPAAFTPRLSVLSFDIETDPQARRLLSIALYGGAGCDAREVLLFTPAGYPAPAGATSFPSERELLLAFCQRVRELDPDILTGWNVIDFDLLVLSRIGSRVGVPLDLGRAPGALRVEPVRSRMSNYQATIPGRVVLDGIQLLRGAFIRMEEYSLDAVSREVLGEGKTLSRDKGPAAIVALFKGDRERFVEYNLTDARLALQIVEKLHMVELSVERSRLTGMPLDRVSASIASFDFLYLSELLKRGVVAPTVGADDEPDEPTAGGHVLTPQPGLYRNVLMFDFRSLYPSLIRTFQIDPLNLLPRSGAGPEGPLADPVDCIVAPTGAAFRREPGILTQLLDELFPMREAAKKAGDRVKSHAIKILMNSFYGVLGTSACRFYNPELANAITGFGKEVLLWSKARIEAAGHPVLYGDTDSLFALSGEADPERAQQVGEALVRDLNRELSEHIRRTWGVESRLDLEFETVYLRLLLPRTRGGAAGARKRYAGLVMEGGEPRVVFTGMEVVRRDWTTLARQVQRELYERLFSDRPVEAYVQKVVKDLRQGRLDSLLVYRKALRKDLSAYTTTTPPHVAAARKMAGPPGRVISYVMTVSGPEPAEGRQSALDHEHYVQKQVRPVAEPVLTLLHLDFDRVVGDNTQLELFSGV